LCLLRELRICQHWGMRRPSLFVVSLAGLLVGGLGLASCGPTTSTSETKAAREEQGLARTFTESATRNDVPRDLLVAIAQIEGGLDMPATREIDPENAVPVAGPLQLRRGKLDTLARGAALMGVTELELRRDTALGLEAGARVLRELGDRTGARVDDLASWSAAIEEMSGYADAYHRRVYARRVLELLGKGGTFLARDAETIAITSHLVDLDRAVPKLDAPMKGAADYADADWFPTSCTDKCTPGRGGNTIQYVVIHDTEGGWDASVATLQNDPGKSVQYIVGTDGRVGQFIHESDTAWHAGNFWYNQRSVGIEHVGYWTKPYPEALYASSAKLVAYLTDKYKVAKDRAHIIGHDQIPNGTKISESAAPCNESPASCEAAGSNYGGSGHHTDPGDFEWCLYMPRFGGTCKCNDIWELWNCSSDKTKAFRCVSGKIEIATCDGPGGCEVMPLGTADVCHEAPPVTDAAPPKSDAAVDTGSTSSDSGAKSDSAVTSTHDGATDDAGTPGGDGDTGGDGGGCGVSRERSNAGTGLGALAAIGVALALTVRRRR
jgi:hypothetical protein